MDASSQEQADLDLSSYKTAAGAAKALHRYLVDDHDADAQLYRPEENPRQNGAWGVNWEGGPFEWALCLSGGESLYRAALNRPLGTQPQVVGISGRAEWHAEPHFSFDLQFYQH